MNLRDIPECSQMLSVIRNIPQQDSPTQLNISQQMTWMVIGFEVVPRYRMMVVPGYSITLPAVESGARSLINLQLTGQNAQSQLCSGGRYHSIIHWLYSISSFSAVCIIWSPWSYRSSRLRSVFLSIFSITNQLVFLFVCVYSTSPADPPLPRHSIQRDWVAGVTACHLKPGLHPYPCATPLHSARPTCPPRSPCLPFTTLHTAQFTTKLLCSTLRRPHL